MAAASTFRKIQHAKLKCDTNNNQAIAGTDHLDEDFFATLF